MALATVVRGSVRKHMSKRYAPPIHPSWVQPLRGLPETELRVRGRYVSIPVLARRAGASCELVSLAGVANGTGAKPPDER